MKFVTRSLSPQESRIVLSLVEEGRREIVRSEIINLLGVSKKAADHVINSLHRKGWLERASWGKYLLISPDQGTEAFGESNLLALASRITESYYFGFGTAATHYGFTTQHRNVIQLVTSKRLRNRHIGDALVRIVNPITRKFFGFCPVNVFGYEVIMSDYEKTVIDCVDHPELAGGIGEAAYILAIASRKIDWEKVVVYLERIGSVSLIRRFGWLVDHVRACIPHEQRERLLSMAGDKRKTYLSPKDKLKGAVDYSDTWHLLINVPQEELHESAGLGRQRIIKR